MKSEKIPFITKLALWFIKPQYSFDMADSELKHIVKFKIFRKRIYLLEEFWYSKEGKNE